MKMVWAALVGALIALGSAADGGQPDATNPPPPSSQEGPSEGRLEQLVAPIALYPDALLGQILMASAYPLEVVDAERWRRDPANAGLQSDALAAALQNETWDPSVKSLTAWPEVLAMMDGQIEWTEALGEAFIANPADVMDAVQRLRAKAYAAQRLASGPEMTVSDDDGEIGIAPTDASTVYAPTYDPDVVFGPWGWPDDPPFTFSGWYDDCQVGDLGWCWAGFPYYPGFWGWDTFDWRGHRLTVDNGRWNGGRGLGGAGPGAPGTRGPGTGRPGTGGPGPSGRGTSGPGTGGPGSIGRGTSGPGTSGRGTWAYDPSHRRGVPYQTAAASERIDDRPVDGPSQRATQGFADPGRADIERADTERAEAERAQAESRRAPTFESFGSGAEARAWAQRGYASRTSSFAGSSFRGGGFGGFRGGGRPR
jgi:Protein of unknown function (DUF3300)